MKKTFWVLGMLVFAGIAGASDFAAEEAAEEAVEEIPGAGKIRPMGETLLRSRIDSLERRIVRLEEDLRYLEERTRNLDRQIDDLSRRH